MCSFASKTDGADREIYEVSFSREFKVVLYGYNAASSRHDCLEQCLLSEVESWWTSLASRTHFEVLGFEGQVLGLGIEASSPRKLSGPRLELSTIFWIAEILLENAKNFAKNLRRSFLFFSFGDCLKKNFKDLFCFFCRPFFWKTLASISLVLGLYLEHSCPWSREGLSSEGLSLASASSLVPSTPPLSLTLL